MHRLPRKLRQHTVNNKMCCWWKLPAASSRTPPPTEMMSLASNVQPDNRLVLELDLGSSALDQNRSMGCVPLLLPSSSKLYHFCHVVCGLHTLTTDSLGGSSLDTVGRLLRLLFSGFVPLPGWVPGIGRCQLRTQNPASIRRMSTTAGLSPSERLRVESRFWVKSQGNRLNSRSARKMFSTTSTGCGFAVGCVLRRNDVGRRRRSPRARARLHAFAPTHIELALFRTSPP